MGFGIRTVRPYSLSSIGAEREGPNSLRSRSANLPRPANGWGFFPSLAATNKYLAQMNKSPEVAAALVQKTRELRKSFKEVFGSTRNAERKGPNTATLDPLC